MTMENMENNGAKQTAEELSGILNKYVQPPVAAKLAGELRQHLVNPAQIPSILQELENILRAQSDHFYNH